VGQTIAYEDRQNCKDMINSQLIRQDYMRNFASEADRHVLPYEFVWNVAYQQDSERNARVALSMLRDMKVPLYRTEIEEKTGFKIASDEEIIQPSQQVFTGMELE
jgi:phage gp29-like protein